MARPKKYNFEIGQIRNLIEDQKIQLWKVADMLGASTATIERFCKQHSLKTQKRGSRKEAQSGAWNGGRNLSNGYLYIYSPEHPARTKHNYVFEHRLVMEKKIGRLLLPNEKVHHIDGNRLNNDIDNLFLFQSNGEHLRHERKGKCPNWSEKGLRDMREKQDLQRKKKMKYSGSFQERRAQAAQQWRMRRKLSESGDNQQPLPSGHPTS